MSDNNIEIKFVENQPSYAQNSVRLLTLLTIKPKTVFGKTLTLTETVHPPFIFRKGLKIKKGKSVKRHRSA